jgi:hypothetical protein
MENERISDLIWERWQSAYALLRREAFSRIREAIISPLEGVSMKRVTFLSNVRECVIELTWNDVAPASWTVRHATRMMWFKQRIGSRSFSDEQQALAFADELKQKHLGRHVA